MSQLINNIFLMLSYNFDALNNKCYTKCAYEEYHNITDLFASILSKGINKTVFGQEQLRQGRIQGYKQVAVPSINRRGIIQSTNPRPRLHNGYNNHLDKYELTLDTPINQVFKATLMLLLNKQQTSTTPNRLVKREIKTTLIKLNDVGLPAGITENFSNTKNTNILLNLISKLDSSRTPKTYKMLLTISNLAVLSNTPNPNQTACTLHPFDEESICIMFKQFMIEYYRKHYKLYKILPPIIRWNNKEPNSTPPPMRADLIISNYYNKPNTSTSYVPKSFASKLPEKKLIALTRYNTDIQDPIEQDSPMLNDIFKLNTMLKEISSIENACNTTGILIYVSMEQSNNQVYNKEYLLGKDKALIKSINLNNNFQQIKKQLDEIISVLN